MRSAWSCLALAGTLALLGAGGAEAMTMTEAYTAAYRMNPALLAEQAKLRALDEQVALAKSGMRPSVDLVGNAGYMNQDPPMMAGGDKNLHPRSATVQVSQPLFRGGRTVAAIRGAKEQVMAGRARLEQAEQNLFYETGVAFLNLRHARDVLELRRSNESMLAEQLAATSKRLAVGEVTKTDEAQSRSRLEQARAARIMAEGDKAAAKATFARLVGENAEAPIDDATTAPLTDSLDQVLARAEQGSPMVLAATHAETAAKESVSQATGALLPEVNLVGRASRGWDQSVMVTKPQNTAQIMAELTIPLYRSGADHARARAARQEATASKLQVRDAQALVREAAIAAWNKREAARAAVEAQRAHVAATEMALAGVREEYKVGTRTTLDVLNAEQESLDARVALSEAQRDEQIANLALRVAAGTLTAKSLNLSVALYNPEQHYEASEGKWVGWGE